MNQSQLLYKTWCDHVPQGALLDDLHAISQDEKEINERFYRTLSFGTAGLRGILGAGTNRMNLYTVGAATQGLCRWLCAHYPSPTVAIAYDSRHNSKLFAEHSAAILAAGGVSVWLYSELMPTPALSFAILHLKCQSGIVITASHNPAKYNGYKVYGEDGSQISPEIASEIEALINQVDYFSDLPDATLEEGIKSGKIRYIEEKTIDAYLAAVLAESVDPQICKRVPLSVVYTPLNGAGNRCVRRVLKEIGVKEVAVVPEQENPDGDFPTCPYPNPEEASAMQKGIDLARTLQYDILLATDPDCDRAGVAVYHKGDYHRLSGNEIGVLMLRYIVQRRRELGTLPQNPVAVKSLVSTKLADRLAKEMGVEMKDVLTGFKYIGEQIALLEEQGQVERFILGFEESSGYLTGPHARDKDAVNASMIICEMAAYYKEQGKTLLDVLDDIYEECGRYLNVVDSYTFEGADGSVKMAQMLSALRANTPKELGGWKIAAVGDYKERICRNADGSCQKITLPQADILEYRLENGASVIVRPSGTEPKIKIYYSLVAKTLESAQEIYKQVGAAIRTLLGV